jgi:tetratricopeptide (TPR) repeat protein
MKIACWVLRVALGLPLAVIIAWPVVCAGATPTARAYFSNSTATINGQPVRLALDTGSAISFLSSTYAKRLNLKVTPPGPGDEAESPWGKIPLGVSEPARVTIGAQVFTVPLLVANYGKHSIAAIGWPEIQGHILVFDGGHRTIGAIPKMVDTSGWLKLKIHRDQHEVLTLEMPRPDGGTGLIYVDTGNPCGVVLPAAQWKEWKTAHPRAPNIHVASYGIPILITWTISLEKWADEIQLGPIALTDVAVHGAKGTGIEQRSDYAGTFGMYALARMDLLVDGPGGFAYLRAKPPLAPLKPGADLSVVAYDNTAGPAGNGDWAVEDSVRLNTQRLLADSAARLAMTAYRNGNYPAAITAFTHALQLDPQNADAFLFRGDAKEKQGDYDGAIADYSRVLELEPKNVEAYQNRGVAKSEKGDNDGAIADYSQALQLDPTNAVVLLYRGYAKSTTDDNAGAVADYSRVLELEPHNADAYNGRGNARFMQDDAAGAMADYNTALQLDPQNADFYLNRGMTKQNLGDFTGALADYDQTVAVSPDKTSSDVIDASLNRQLLLFRLGRADQDFPQVVAGWKPGWEKTVGRFMTGGLSENDFLAAAVTGDAATVRGQQCDAYYTMGMVRLSKGDQAGAREFFQKSLSVGRPEFGPYQFARAELARMNGATSK